LWRNCCGINENQTQQAAFFSERFEGYVLDFTHVLTGLSPRQLTELTILAKPSSLALLLDYSKARSALQQRFAIAFFKPERAIVPALAPIC
jgi:hypothetical protein